MRLIVDAEPCSPSFGLALEEAIFDHVRGGGEDALRIWSNRRAVILGRSQSAVHEVDMRRATSASIPVLRRISGGGTVYHYPGNLNISLHVRNGRGLEGVKETFIRLGEIIGAALLRLGIRTSAQGNALFIAGKKIGGAAQARRGNSLLYHTTLLVRPDTIPMQALLLALRKDYRPIGVRSQPHPMTTLAETAQISHSMNEFASVFAGELCKEFDQPLWKGYPTLEENERAHELVEEKYGCDKWNLYR